MRHKKKPRFVFDVSALAIVRQTGIEIEAETEEEARRILGQRIADGVWQYQGICDDSIESELIFYEEIE